MSPRRLDGKIALITGAARGLGAAIARRFAAEGATVVLTDLNEAGGAETAAEIGNAASFLRVDAGDWGQMRESIDATVARHGRLDLLINNAGTIRTGLVADFSLDHFDLLMRTNIGSVFYGCKAAIPHMQRQGGGTIINMASIAGLRGEYLCAAYCASKAAIVNFTRALALDHAEENIRVNAICPGSIDTQANAPLFALPGFKDSWLQTIPRSRFGQPDDVASLAAYLASDEADFMVGQAIAIDGGTSTKVGQPDWKRLARAAGRPGTESIKPVSDPSAL